METLGLMAATLHLGFLGASGSFSERAALVHAGRLDRPPVLLGAPAPATVLALVASGAVERAVLPVANSSAGLVWPTLAALAGCSLELVDEVVLPVRFTLFVARPGITLESVERVASHPMALRQCARSLARLLPGHESVAWSDSASAARDLAAGVLDARTAVLAAEETGARHELVRLASDVQDDPAARTFFAVLAVPGSAGT